MSEGKISFPVLEPNLQIAFYHKLQRIRTMHLNDALRLTVSELSIRGINEELDIFVPSASLAKVSSVGLRGETIFPVPCVIKKNPFLLAYYRLLLGFSQKEFYNKGPFARFKTLEEGGQLPPRVEDQIPALCRSLVQSAMALVDGIESISLDTIHELQLLTLGPQLRGSQNTRIGQTATKEVFDLIRQIVAHYVQEETGTTILIRNESNRTVMLEFASDPDLLITESLPSSARILVSIEIKGGQDKSNVFNRLGEAEKSHLKAKSTGCNEFWTILRSPVDLAKARSASPTTTHFFDLDKIKSAASDEGARFREFLGSLMGISTLG